MRKSAVALLLLMLAAPLTSARSVHSIDEFDLLPDGDFDESGNWQVINQKSFDASLASEYTTGTIIDGEFKVNHTRDMNYDIQTKWATESPTNSNASKGVPDGAYVSSTGPDIILSGFDVSVYDEYPLLQAHLVIAFAIPDNLFDDTVRFSIKESGNNDLIKTWAHTNSRIDYINGSHWSYDLTSERNWTWGELNSLEVKLDYVSSAPDDTRLEVDAVGIRVKMQTPWNGVETSKAQVTYTPKMWPLVELDLSMGVREGLSLGIEGLSPSVNGTTGTWTSEAIEAPPSQKFGRINAEADLVEFSTSDDGSSWSLFNTITSSQLVTDKPYLKIRLSEDNRTISRVSVDFNDPTLSIKGNVFGNYAGLDSNLSMWFAKFNGQVVATGDIDQDYSIDSEIPVGRYMSEGEDFSIELGVQVKWSSDGSPSSFEVNINHVELSGGFEIQWDENPTCLEIQDLDFVEDGGGLLIPVNPRCEDDRTAIENLTVSAISSDEEVLISDIVDDQLRVRLVPEASGFVIISLTVTDEAGNTWTQDIAANVATIDDPPEIEDFTPTAVRIELGKESNISFTVYDIDTPFDQLTFVTDLSWAEVDESSRSIILNPPAVGYHTVVFSACDAAQCVNSNLDLEVLSLPDLFVEDIEISQAISGEVTEGDIVSIDVYVRNTGHEDAHLVGVRCMESESFIESEQIAVLKVGEIEKVTCDWKVPGNLEVAMIRGIVDYYDSILESDEDNNEAKTLLKVEGSKPISKSSDDTSSALPSSLTLGGAGVLLLLITIFFIVFAPAKIRKVE